MAVHNFSAGPAVLPKPVLERAQEELVDYRGVGYSIVEASHRSKIYDEVHQSALSRIRSLLEIDEEYEVMLVGGGATLQFAMAPLNLLGDGESCDFILSGSWAKKALSDAEKVGNVKLAFDGSESAFMTLPDPGGVRAHPGSAYLHLTSNETIEGIQWRDFPDLGSVPIVADMSSDIFSRPLPISRFGVIYAGAQKNAGPAGVTVVIARRDLIEKQPRTLPAYLSYRTHADKASLYNTPPVFAVYLMNYVLEWIEEQGGVQAMERRSEERSGKVYEAIKRSRGFYRAPAQEDVRSRMNVVFRLADENLEPTFLEEAEKEGLVGLKGHRSVGGIRASIYNALPDAAVDALVEFMTRFASRHG